MDENQIEIAQTHGFPSLMERTTILYHVPVFQCLIPTDRQLLMLKGNRDDGQ